MPPARRVTFGMPSAPPKSTASHSSPGLLLPGSTKTGSVSKPGPGFTPPAPPTRKPPRDAPVSKPPVKDRPEPSTRASSLAGGASTAAGLAGLGLGFGGAGLSGAFTTAGTVATAGILGDTSKDLAHTASSTLLGLGEQAGEALSTVTEFLSQPEVLIGGIVIIGLIYVGPSLMKK